MSLAEQHEQMPRIGEFSHFRVQRYLLPATALVFAAGVTYLVLRAVPEPSTNPDSVGSIKTGRALLEDSVSADFLADLIQKGVTWELDSNLPKPTTYDPVGKRILIDPRLGGENPAIVAAVLAEQTSLVSDRLTGQYRSGDLLSCMRAMKNAANLGASVLINLWRTGRFDPEVQETQLSEEMVRKALAVQNSEDDRGPVYQSYLASCGVRSI
jgi:hypothetical protein